MIKILAIIGDRFHDPEILRAGLLPLESAECKFVFVVNPEQVPWASLSHYAAIVLAKGGYDFSTEMSHRWLGDNDRHLAGFVNGGGGLLILHSGLAGYADNEMMRELCKGSFTHHSDGIIPQSVRRVENGLFPAWPEFAVADEQYCIHFHSRDTTEFLATHSEAQAQASAGWAHTCGRGRVACLTPGHTAEVFAAPTYRQILQEVLRWVAAVSK